MKLSTPFATLATLALAGSAAAFPAFVGKGEAGIAELLARAESADPEFYARAKAADEAAFQAFRERSAEIRKGGEVFKKRADGKRSITALIDPASFKFNDAEQTVDLTSDEHKWIAPGPNDIRGPCPGLNLLANHGYLNRNGVTTLTQGIDAISKVFGVGLDLAAALNAYAVLFNGNLADLTWSIGGPYGSSGLGGVTNLLFGKPQGINAHNIYEGDASIVRQDYYEPGANNDNVLLKLDLFKELLADGGNNSADDVDVFTPEVMLKHKSRRWHQSVERNPLFFNSAFGGLVVTTAAERFVAEFAANNTADENGNNRIYLDEKNLFAFFSVERQANGELKYTPGHERLLPSWKRRPLGSPFSLVDIVLTLLNAGRIDPSLLSVGGNAGKVNTFSGVNAGDISGGVFNTAQLLQDPQALSCFLYQATVTELIPTQIQGLYKVTGAALDFLAKTLTPAWSKLKSGDEPCQAFNTNAAGRVSVADAYKKFPGSKGSLVA